MKRPPISKGELDVARTIWKLKEATLGTIHEALAATTDVEYATVQTYIRRLEAKGYLTSRRVGRTKLYRAKIRPQLVIRDAIDELVQSLFEGERIPLVRHLFDEGQLSGEEIDELKQMLDRLGDQQ